VLPDETTDALLSAIDSARQRLWITIYQVTDRRFVEALKRAAQRGVDVRLILEDRPQSGAEGNDLVAGELREAGVQVQPGNPVFRYTHQKSVLVDGSSLWVLTGNFTVSAATANREYQALTSDSAAVAEAERAFTADWSLTDAGLAEGRLIWSPDNARPRTVALIDGARTSLLIEQQSLSDRQFVSALQNAARRGVDVRFVTTPSYPLADDPEEPAREALRQAGVGVRYLASPYVHAKVMVVDGAVGYLGSANWTATAMDLNRELALETRTAAAVDELARSIDADWRAASEEAFPVRATPPPGGVIMPDAADGYLYQEVAVAFTVAQVRETQGAAYLRPAGGGDFQVVIPRWAYDRFEAPPPKLYPGRRVRVRGLIEPFQGRPEIRVAGPEQIEVLR
jgi:phosphatidylserine/phosphatidylglycerophosphate/cardiolipin synthase-like enzyme